MAAACTLAIARHPSASRGVFLHGLRRVPTAAGVLLVLVSLGCSGCNRLRPVREIPAYETLLLVLSDYRRFADTDLYRHGIPKDISGQNIFRATLERLHYFAETNPDTDTDIIDFTRGEAYARLGDFGRAVEHFSKVAGSESPLAPKAGERRDILRLFRAALDKPTGVDQLGKYLAMLDQQCKDMEDLAAKFRGTYEGSLARRELERIETERALVTFRNRYVLDRAAPRAIEMLQDMIEKHGESRRIHAHRLLLGRFYFELARDMAILAPPDRLGFDADLFTNLVSNAQEQFAMVSQADGYPEKLEAAGLLREVEAFARNVRNDADLVLPGGMPK